MSRLVNRTLLLNRVKATADLAGFFVFFGFFCYFFIKQLLEKIPNYRISLGRQHGKLKSKFADGKNHHNNPVLRDQVHTGSKIPD